MSSSLVVVVRDFLLGTLRLFESDSVRDGYLENVELFHSPCSAYQPSTPDSRLPNPNAPSVLKQCE